MDEERLWNDEAGTGPAILRSYEVIRYLTHQYVALRLVEFIEHKLAHWIAGQPVQEIVEAFE